MRAVAEHLVGDDEDAYGSHQRERSQRGQRERRRDERKRGNTADRAVPEDASGSAVEEGHMCEEVERNAAAQRNRRDRVERLGDVMHGRLETEREKDDATDER